MSREIVIDSNTLRRRDFATWLRDRMGWKWIPSVVYAELARYSIHKGESPAQLHDYLAGHLGLTVERMDHNHGVLAAQLAHAEGPDQGWHQRARDYFIAAHVARTGRVLVTQNLKDFTCLGPDAISVDEAMRTL